MTLYEAAGGLPFFTELVDHFYDGVAQDGELLSLYPEPHDLAPARRRLSLFLAQYWGGPTTYSDERGHPRLRARHLPFAIGNAQRDRWMHHMREAVEAMDPPTEIAEALMSYFTSAADAMRNTGLTITVPGATGGGAVS
jgi:hemoglobin